MENEGDAYSGYSESGGLIEPPKKQIFRLQLPYVLRFAIIWTLFFSIIGIAIQYFQKITPTATPAFLDVFNGFFTTEYAAWFKNFGSFADVTLYPSAMDFIYSLLGHWYYFFFTGGVIALIWGLLSWIINFELVVKKKTKYEKIKEDAARQREFLAHRVKISDLLLEGKNLLEKGKIPEAKEKYNEMRNIYDQNQDKDNKLKRDAYDFYNALLKKEQEMINKRVGMQR